MNQDDFIQKVLSKTFWGSFLFLNGEVLGSNNFEGVFYNGEYVDDEDELEILREWIVAAMNSKSTETIDDTEVIWKKYPIEVLEDGRVLDFSKIETEPTHDIFFVIFMKDNTWEIQIEETEIEFEDSEPLGPDEYWTDEDIFEDEDGVDIYVNPDELVDE